jgi:hypothetical protein
LTKSDPKGELTIAMNCKNLLDCGFLKKLSGSMPHTTDMVKLTYCTDKDRCVINRLATTMIVYLEDNGLQDEK